MFCHKYIHPSDGQKLGQAELVCIDEAAAIPLPLVKSLMGPYLVFMSSTINGYVLLLLVLGNVYRFYFYVCVLVLLKHKIPRFIDVLSHEN